MPRKHPRTLRSDQVVSDQLLWKRQEARFALNVPPSQAQTTYPLVGSKAERGIFEVAPPLLKLTSDGHTAPTLVYSGHKIFATSRDRETTVNFSKTQLWTRTTKMSAPSFGLPAGPTSEGGTCAAANVAKGKGRRTPGKKYVCDLCYSLEGSYVFFSSSIASAARQSWVSSTLAKDADGTLLAQSLTAGIADFARNAGASTNAFGGLEKRIILELGIWREGRIQIPWSHPVSRSQGYLPALETKLFPGGRYRTTTEFIAKRNPADGEVVGFFRIHDAGDINIGKSSSHWKKYLNAWTVTARAFPNVIFWLPTRAWIFPKVKQMLIEAYQAAPNLVIRASALNVGEKAPSIKGLPAGSSVAQKIGVRKYAPPPNPKNGTTYLCPVNTRFSEDVTKSGNQRWSAAKSCELAQCRACWIRTDLASAFGEH